MNSRCIEERLHVVAGILRDANGQVLLAQRPPGKHLAGRWEFPGGKCEAGESPQAALRRELHEELGVRIDNLQPLIRIPWHYAEKSILLDVWQVDGWTGDPHGREGQALRWADASAMSALPMPDADRPIVNALRLPQRYAITAHAGDDAAFVSRLQRLFASGHRLLQMRCSELDDARFRALAQIACRLASQTGADLLVNAGVDLARELDVGLHLNTKRLRAMRTRPIPASRWLAASCHDAAELELAARIGVDFAVLGPVLPTASHPGASALGWETFARLCEQAPFPVFALGGMREGDIDRARAAGAQGVAGISAFWPA